MKKDSPFFHQAQLMMRILPIVYREKCFGLKGGTAINFFLRDMPRLSVDIDLTYLPLDDRDTALRTISTALTNISNAIKKAFPGTKVHETISRSENRVSKLVVSPGANQVKIEPNEVLRGALYGTEDRDAAKAVQKLFETSATARCLSLADLYGGKICALLDRQHPRDMFDVKDLLAAEGITEQVRRAFVVYLAGHNRPMDELLSPKFKDMEGIYEREFVGMTTKPVTYKSLTAARDKCLAALRKALNDQDKRFLISLMEQKPQWDILGIPDLEKLPSLQWKLRNIALMTTKKRETALAALRKALDA